MQKLASTPKNAPHFFIDIKSKKGTTLKCADPKSTRAMVSLMDMNAVLGGAAAHYGGPAAFAELMSATHALMFNDSKKQNKEWHQLYNFVNDAGHCENGLYALKANYGFADLTFEDLKHFRSIKSKLTGHGEVHLFPNGVQLSNGPLGSAFPQSQGLAMSDALSGGAYGSRVTITAISDGACMEGEAREALAAVPGLASVGKIAPYILIISDNNTKLSGRIDKDSFSMNPTFDSLKTLGWEVIDLKNGNSLQDCVDTIEVAIEMARANPKKPIAIHAKTVKGIGTQKTAESSSGGHGFPLKSPTELTGFLTEIYCQNEPTEIPNLFTNWIDDLIKLESKIKLNHKAPPLAHLGDEKIQNGVSSAMIQARKNGLPIVSITSDLPGSTGVAGFRKEFPQFSFDVGIAESNMVSVAAGFSKNGFIPVVDTFAQFGVTKGALPLTMAMLSEAPIIAVYSHTGFQDAADGASHQALNYLSMVAGIPNVKAFALSCSEEAHTLMMEAFETFSKDVQTGKTPSSYIFFLGRENFPKSYVTQPKANYKLNQAQIVRQSTLTPSPKAVTIVASGSCLHEAVIAHDELLKSGIHSTVINPICINHIDIETLKKALVISEGRVITVEDHQLIGGFGSIVAHSLAINNINFELKTLGVAGAFGQSAYSAKELYQKHNFDSEAICNFAKEWF